MRLCDPILALALLTGGLALAADGWPQPAPGWWSRLDAGQRATYALTDGSLRLTRTVEVDAVDEHVLTLSTTLELGERRLPKQTRTVDARALPFPPPSAGALRELRRETLTLAGRSWPCTVYELKTPDERLVVWRSQALAPVFAGGCVRLSRTTNAGTSQAELAGYTGP